MRADLHMHSTASDGSLTPEELLGRAAAAGVELMSITDHDTVNAYRDLPAAASGTGPRLIPGVEFSARWRKLGIHIVGLNIDPQSAAMQTAGQHQARVRNNRAERIAAKLEKLGFTDTLAGARQLAGDASIGRPHFARYLVDSGQISSEPKAFQKYLGQGKTGDVREDWPETEAVIDWIESAGGVAVLAHPGKYKLTNLKLETLVQDFAAAGGRAIEVLCGQQEQKLTRKLEKLANRNGLAASCGSDFHSPQQHWAQVGAVALLPRNCVPVWEIW